MRSRTALLSVFVLLAVDLAFAAAGKFELPPWFPNPGGKFDVSNGIYHDYDEATFVVPGAGGSHVTVRGHYWHVALNTRKNYGKRWLEEGPAVWKQVETQLLGEGFRKIYDKENWGGPRSTFQRGDGDHATYVDTDVNFHSDGAWLTIVEVAPNRLAAEATPPRQKPESFTDKDPFPYIPLLPGSMMKATQHENAPLPFVSGPHARAELVGSGYVHKEYADPTNAISEMAFREAYANALQKAGWTITSNEASGALFARYDRNGRELYARLSPRFHSIDIADVGASLASTLAANCKANLYGVNFDFDKATIRPDSDTTLAQVAALLQSDPKLSLEIGGHTDNIGKPEYNMTLSDKRAAAVKDWLVAHGVAASRLSSHGYGDTKPLVPNTNDENRALNRRVELKKPGCA